jgi:hypothetical protein
MEFSSKLENVIIIYKTYTPKLVTQVNSIIPFNIKGLVKDIMLITRPLTNSHGFSYQDIIYNYDIRYQRYLDASKYYTMYKNIGYYTDPKQYDFVDDFTILQNVDNEILNDPDNRNNQNLDKNTSYNRLVRIFYMYDPRFLMYYIKKYCCSQVIISDKNVQQEGLFYYLKYLYNNTNTINEISPIDSMIISVNGVDLFSNKDYNHFTSLVPNSKFNTSLPIGNYAYTFSLFPLEKQPSGHLNFTHYDDILFTIKSNRKVINEPYKIIPVVKEYNILRIMSGIGSLAWI